MNVASLVLDRARREPEAIALRQPAGRHPNGRIRYEAIRNRELDQGSDALARGLEALGLRRGTRTAVMVLPGRDLFELMLALFTLGAVPILVDPGIGLGRLRRCLDEARPEAFVGTLKAQIARRLLGWARRTIRLSVTAGVGHRFPGPTLDRLRLQGPADVPRPIAEPSDDEIAAILFTSGSTGPPKGVVYRHAHFAAQVEALRALGAIEPGEVDLPTFPPFALFDPALGMTSVMPAMDPTRPGSVDPRRILEPIEEFGATHLFGSPALVDTVGRWGAARGVKLPTLRRVVSAGAPVSGAVMTRFLEMMPEGAEILTPYGATECLPVACISSREVLAETAARTDRGAGICVGAPVPSIDVRILAIEDGPIPRFGPELELSVGEIGEIVVAGPQATDAYDGRPEATALAKTRDPDGRPWHRMGDVGYLDASGRLWYCGRKADRVETRAGTLFSIPCEAIFDTHPDVRRTALVGIPAPRGAIPVLCVELHPGGLAGSARRRRRRVEAELLDLGARHETTRTIRRILFHRGFPVDIRHNAKIDRGALARWADRRRRRLRTPSPERAA